MQAAIGGRKPPPGCVYHSDRGSQYAAGAYRELLTRHGLIGGGAATPYDNAKAESVIKALRVEAVYPMAYETFEDVAADLPRFIDYSTIAVAAFSPRLPEPRELRGATHSVHGQTSRLTGVQPGTHSNTGSTFDAD